jgi:Transposase
METEQERLWFAGVDWGSQTHQVHVADAQGRERGTRGFAHTGEGLAAMAMWISRITGATADAVHVAIEVPHGPVVESLMERGFNLYSINPRQLDRFRDRFSPSGAKDDSRDALVLCDSLRTDPRSYRALEPLDPVLVELREWSRILEELTQDRLRLANRLSAQLWRYYPQILTPADDVTAPWFIALWQLLPTPVKAARGRKSSIARVLKTHRIRRICADDVLTALRATAIPTAPGTTDAAVAHIHTLVKRLEPAARQSG